MIVENCEKCGGTHIGSYACPIFCICCASGNDLPEGEYCRACGRTKGVQVDEDVRTPSGETGEEAGS